MGHLQSNQKFPEEHDFMRFFGAPPEVSDPDVPWIYNRLRYAALYEDEILICEIEPAYGDMTIQWQRNGHIIGKFTLQEINTMEIAGGRHPVLVATFAPERKLALFKLRLKPRVQIEWGTEMID